VKRITSVFLFIATLGWLASSAWGQQVSAAITGKVTDPSGAAVVNAKITATDVDRGTQWTTTSNSDGAFNIPRVPIGTYDVKVEQQGFQTATQSHIALEMNQIARLDFQLQVGSLSQTVEVTSSEPLLQTQDTSLGQHIDATTNEELPLATRNYVQLTLLAPGSIHPDPSSFKTGSTTMNSGRPNVNGNREQANNFMLDGLDNNQVSENDVGYAPSVDAIAEFNEITNNAPAEFGNFMGAIISTTTKSGTNQYHGDGFEFFRNNVLNANEWSNNFNDIPRDIIRWNNFGGAVGGPIKKDKLFFFADYQGSRDATPTSIVETSLFTSQERTGNFSQLLSLATPIQLYNPFATSANGARAPFPGNIIPASLISPVASAILSSSYYPQATGTGLINNYSYATRSSLDGDQGDVKIDWNISDKDRFYGRYSESRYDNPGINSLPLVYNSFSTTPTHTGVIDWTRTVSPSLVNEARFGVNYVFNDNGASSNGVNGFAQTVGIPGVPSNFLPSLNFQSGFAATIGNSDIHQLFADAVIHYEDTVIYTKGSHTMHMGFQAFRYRIDTFYSGNNGEAGTINFNGQYTTSTTATSGGTGGQGLAEADFLLGLPDEIQGGVNGGTWGQRSDSVAAFYQDDWRVTPNLTLNLGLRWELHTPWDEVKNRQTNFNLATGAEYISGQSCPYNNCNALYNQYNGITNFQPRLGIAWTPGGGKLVIRSGYTVSNYLEGTGTNLRLPINPPFAHENDDLYTNLQQYGTAPGSTLSQGFLPFTTASNPFEGATLRIWDPNVRPAVSNQWNLTLQYQLNKTTTVQASYVGQRATHLMVPMPYFQKVLNPNGTVSPTEYLEGSAFGQQLLSEIGQISGTASIGNQDYEALQMQVRKHLGSGLEYSVAYTYSKCMTNNMGYYGQGGQASQSNWYYQNIYDAAAEWGPCDYDATQNFVANAVYDLPFGHGRTFGNNWNKALDYVAGGWEMAGILSVHTGFAMTIAANDGSNTGSRGARADCISPVTIYGTQNSPGSVGNGYQWFSAGSFAQPSDSFGSCGVGTVRGPGLSTVDFNLSKGFRVTEHQSVNLRAEFINLTNTPILNSPNTYFSPTLGLLNSSNPLSGREIQFALKYIF